MVVLYFYTDNKICTLVDELLQDSENDIYYINASKNTQEVDRYNICTTPTLIFLGKDGAEQGRLISTQNFKHN